MMKYVIERAKEPSTWRGLIMLLTAVGVNISPDMIEYIIGAGMGLAGIAGAVLPDTKA